ncbi:MAG: dienelactone hydrolase family protein, partial [Syntrophales bacterium]|nr:dienelactone hydrolase family protein [Syntrophales bacterium]
YDGLSRREFLAGVGIAGAGLAGFALAATPVAGKVIATSAEGLVAADGTVLSGGFAVPVYEVRPAARGTYPVVLVVPEVFGMHEHIRDVTRRFAREGYLAVTFEPYAREGCCTCPTSTRCARSSIPFPTRGSWPTWTPSSPGRKSTPLRGPTGSG